MFPVVDAMFASFASFVCEDWESGSDVHRVSWTANNGTEARSSSSMRYINAYRPAQLTQRGTRNQLTYVVGIA